MALNTSKTKFIVFRTHGKKIYANECVLTFNNNEPGQPEDPNLISNIDRIHNEGNEKNFKLLGVLLMNICLLGTIFRTYVPKSLNNFFASIV
jgi:hypothetical protein